MKQKHIIILHPINLCEGNILISQTQIRRIVKAIGDWSQSVRTSMKENGTQYRVRREPSEDVIVDQSPCLVWQIHPRNRLNVSEPLLASSWNFLGRVA